MTERRAGATVVRMSLAGRLSTSAGVADLRASRTLRADDPIRVGSVTKSFTAVVALQLVGEGRLRGSMTHSVGVMLLGVRGAREMLRTAPDTADETLAHVE